MGTCVHFSRSLPSNAWWQTMVGCQVLSRPSAAEGGGRRPAFTRPATQPYSATEADGWQQLSRVSQNRAAVHGLGAPVEFLPVNPGQPPDHLGNRELKLVTHAPIERQSVGGTLSPIRDHDKSQGRSKASVRRIARCLVDDQRHHGTLGATQFEEPEYFLVIFVLQRIG